MTQGQSTEPSSYNKGQQNFRRIKAAAASLRGGWWWGGFPGDEGVKAQALVDLTGRETPLSGPSRPENRRRGWRRWRNQRNLGEQAGAQVLLGVSRGFQAGSASPPRPPGRTQGLVFPALRGGAGTE